MEYKFDKFAMTFEDRRHELLINQICDTDCDVKYMIEMVSSFKIHVIISEDHC